MFLMKRGPKGKEFLYLVEYGHDKTGKRIKTTVKKSTGPQALCRLVFLEIRY